MLRPVILLLTCLAGSLLAQDPPPAQPTHGFTLRTEAEVIQVTGEALDFGIKTKGYVTGIAQQSFLDKKTGFRDPGYGLLIIDWLMEPGSDLAWRDQLTGARAELRYETGNLYAGKTEKRCLEGPQICTGARAMTPEFIHGSDFLAVRQAFDYRTAAPGKNTGSQWRQTLVFPKGKRWCFGADEFTVKNDSEAMFYRMDLPGHLKHNHGDSFSEVYLSYHGTIPAAEFTKGDFAPDEHFNFRRDTGKVPARMIRAYHLRDVKTGAPGPWLAGMTLDPSVVSEAWCHQRGYICFIQENGGHPIKAGASFGAAYITGYFDSIAEMETLYDQYKGTTSIKVDPTGWKLGNKPTS